jgi:hypothetical protein
MTGDRYLAIAVKSSTDSTLGHYTKVGIAVIQWLDKLKYRFIGRLAFDAESALADGRQHDFRR